MSEQPVTPGERPVTPTGQAVTLLDNSAFYPGHGSLAAPPFRGRLRLAQTTMQFKPELANPLVGGRDARLFPGLHLDFHTLDDVLVPLQRGQITTPADSPSYWSLIPQFGHVWRESGDENGWSRAAFPLMLVNDLENHAHQGLASFRYRGGEVSELRFQFVQQTAPYLLKQHFLAWGCAQVEFSELPAEGETARRELASRLPSRPWADLISRVEPGTLDGFGGPLDPKWTVATALVRDGTLYYDVSQTPCGAYPYPLEMRFGVRSIMKSIAAPLSLLRLAQVHGPDVLTLKIGKYVAGLHPKFDSVSLIDAANMATGFGGTGTLRTRPNDFEDGYLEADYDGWYTAASHEEKIAHMAKWLGPYPWDPGTVTRYRDHDFYVLGAAVDAFLKSVRGPDADAWDMLCDEVFGPIGIPAAPATRTREPGGRRGLLWFNAGYFPTLDDIAKIALLYQRCGEWGGQQILHRELTQELLAARGALPKNGDASPAMPGARSGTPGHIAGDTANGTANVASDRVLHGKSTHYRMGFHFIPYRSELSGKLCYLPTMWGSGESEVILYPNGRVSIRIGKAAGLPGMTTNLHSSRLSEIMQRLS
jgi:CubicO group peptidase (beta-lactamase class C family)